MPRPRCPRPSHAACALAVVAAAALLPLAGCGASDSTARSNSAITASACQNKALVGTRMSCPPSATAPASH